MPEGPEIRRAADAIADVLVDRIADSVTFGLPRLHHYQAHLSGQTITDIETRGKALLTHFATGLTIYSHNQLYGKWYVVEREKYPDTNRQLRVAIHTQRHSALLYSASDIAVMPTPELANHPFLVKLGPDILSAHLNKRVIIARLKSEAFCRRSLASLYLDQTFIAGLGNYLRSEILFAAALEPQAKPQQLSTAQLARLAEVTLSVATRSYRTGGYTVPEPFIEKARKHGLAYEHSRFMVFDREAQPCRVCQTEIRRITAQSRRLYYCPNCQK